MNKIDKYKHTTQETLEYTKTFIESKNRKKIYLQLFESRSFTKKGKLLNTFIAAFEPSCKEFEEICKLYKDYKYRTLNTAFLRFILNMKFVCEEVTND